MWRRRLPAIYSDISDLLGRREIFWELQEVAKHNPRITEHGAFFDWVCRNYIDAATIGVRRLTDRHWRRSHSVWWLLKDMFDHPGIINRRAHAALYRGVPRLRGHDIASTSFDGLVGEGAGVLSQSQIRRDIRAVERASTRVTRLVNKRIAHRTGRATLRRLPRFNELNRALDTVDGVLCRYRTLLTGDGPETAFATRQYNWMEALFEPWILSGSKFRPKS